MYNKYFKRVFDFLLALVALIILSPLMLVITILVRAKLGSPIVFKQQRPGRHEKIFTMYKFRTMTDACDKDGILLPDKLRLNNFGKFLRSTSLDELPELVNILKGDMSIVGPRPLLVQYLSLYNQKQKRRHEVRPGLTGWAQVNGRNAISWEQKFSYDVEYVNNLSILFDIKIFLLTIQKVLKRDGINPDNASTMEPFKGTIEEVSEESLYV